MSIFDDVADWVGDVDLTEPSTYLQLVKVLPYTGWAATLLDMYQSWGVIATGADVAIHVAPGLIQGESLTDAIVADYGTRLCIVAGIKIGAVIASASAAASAVLASYGAAASGVTGALGGISGVSLCKEGLQKIKDAAEREIGPQRTNAIADEAQKGVDRDFNQAFARIVADPAFVDLYRHPRVRSALARVPYQATKERILDGFGLGVDFAGERFHVRDDVAALAINTVLHDRIYDVNARTFDVITGERRAPLTVPTSEQDPADATLGPARVRTVVEAETSLAKAEQAWSSAVAREQQIRIRGGDATQATIETAAFGRRVERQRILLEQIRRREQEERDKRARALAATASEAIARANQRFEIAQRGGFTAAPSRVGLGDLLAWGLAGTLAYAGFRYFTRRT